MAAVHESDPHVSDHGQHGHVAQRAARLLHSRSVLRVRAGSCRRVASSVCFRYKKVEDRGPMDDVMFVVLPLLHQRFMQLFAHDDSDQSALIQKQILKIFHAYTQVRCRQSRPSENDCVYTGADD